MRTTRLYVEVAYRARSTDPEGLACALDRLMETAISTPGILEEYGDPQIGPFFVAALDEATRQDARTSEPSQGPAYHLLLDGKLLRQQRRLLWRLNADPAQRRNRRTLEGLIALLDAIADQAHDLHGIDCLEPGT